MEQNAYVQLNTLNNTLGDYVLDADRNINNGFAGLNSSGKILQSVIPYEEYSSLPSYESGRIISVSSDSTAYVATNGNWVKLATDIAAQTYGYHNPDNATQANKIAFGSSATPTIVSPTTGDIYIQI